MSAKPVASPDDIEMSSIFGALKKSKLKLLATSAVLGGLTFAVLSMLAPKYQSQAELAIVAKASSSAFADPKDASAPDTITTKMDQAAINTHVKALQSTELLNRIADELKLKERAEFNAEIGPVDTVDTVMRLIGLGGPRAGESERDRVMNVFRSQLEVYSAKESRFIGVRMTATDPELAAHIANRLGDAYRELLATQSVIEVDDQQKVLQEKITKLAPEVAAAETEADQYRGKINEFRGGTQNTGLNQQQLSELTAELSKAAAARGEAEARAKSAREMMKLGSADALPDVQKSPLIQNLVQQRVRIERQISELSATLLPGHPRMQQLNADLAGLKRQLSGEVAKLVDSLDKEAKVAVGREDSIKKSLDELKSKVVANAPEEAKLRQLEATAKAKRTELESLQQQVEANRKRTVTQAQPVEVKVISRAQAASVPVFPKKGQLSALVAVASLLFGTAWTVTKALFMGARSGGAPAPQRASDATRSAARAEPVLSPLAKSRVATAAPPPAAEPLAKSARPELTIASLASRILAGAPAAGGHRTLVTGETSAIDGVSDAIELAKSLADSGKHVVLIEWNPAGKSNPALSGIASGKGLNDLLLGAVSFEDVVNRMPGSKVHVIGSGGSISGEDVEPDQFNLILDALDEAYDHIVVTGGHDDARNLFEAIEGRFDAGVLVADGKKRTSVLEDPDGTFLGFEVSDIDVIRFQRQVHSAQVNQRILRATRGATEAHSV